MLCLGHLPQLPLRVEVDQRGTSYNKGEIPAGYQEETRDGKGSSTVEQIA